MVRVPCPIFGRFVSRGRIPGGRTRNFSVSPSVFHFQNSGNTNILCPVAEREVHFLFRGFLLQALKVRGSGREIFVFVLRTIFASKACKSRYARVRPMITLGGFRTAPRILMVMASRVGATLSLAVAPYIEFLAGSTNAKRERGTLDIHIGNIE